PAATRPRWRCISTIRTGTASCRWPYASTAGLIGALRRASITTTGSNALSEPHLPDLPRLTLPLTPEQARSLKLGDTVLLDGVVSMTAGLPVHQRIAEALAHGGELPLPLEESAFFHMGSSCRQDGGRWIPNYVNPTTSSRFDAYMPALIRGLRLTSVGGKGGMGAACVEAMREVGCVYFSLPGGASPLLSEGAAERLET